MMSYSNCCSCNNCGNSTNCESSCCSHNPTLTLQQEEIDLLTLLSQLPFLPVVRSFDGETPILAMNTQFGFNPSNYLLAMHAKRLIRIDFDIPITNFSYEGFTNYPCKGSIALTLLGQEALDLIYYQPIEE